MSDHGDRSGSDAPSPAVLLAAWLLPAGGVALAAVASLARAEDAGPAPALRLLACIAWTGFALAPGGRGLLLDLGRRVFGRAHFLLPGLAAAAVAVFGLSSPAWPFWAGAALALALLAVEAGARALRRDRRAFAFGLAILGINLVLLVGLDALVGAYVLPGRSHDNVLVEHDPLLGWRLRPGISLTRVRPDYVATETVNRRGFRTPERPFEKPAGVARVLVLGDSFTETYTVNDDETYPVLLEALLSERRPVEVISLGVAGYSTDQELLAYLEHGRRFEPDLVLLQFCSNDLVGNLSDRYWRGRKPRFERRGDWLLLSGVPVPDVRSAGLLGPELLRRSALALQVESMLRQLSVSRRETLAETDPEEAWRVTDLLLRDLDRAVRSDGARLVVFQADPKPEHRQRLRQVLAQRGIPYLESRDAYSGQMRSYFVEAHWNQKGNRAIAGLLAERLGPMLDGADTAVR